MLLQRSLDYMSFFLLLVSQCTSSKVKLCLFLQHSRTHYTCIHTWMHTSLFYLSFSLLTKWVAIYLHDSWASDLSSSLHYTGHTELLQSKIFLKPHLIYYQFFYSRATSLADRVKVVWKIMKYCASLRKSIEIKKNNDFNPIVLTVHHNMTTARLCWSWETAWKLTDYGLFVLSRQRISLLSAKFTSKWNGVESYTTAYLLDTIYYVRGSM